MPIKPKTFTYVFPCCGWKKTLAPSTERVNDIETPGHINLVCKERVFS